MTDDQKKADELVVLLSGMVIGSLTEAFYELAKELRRYAGGDFDKRLQAVKAKATRSVENAALDSLAEPEQLILVEQTRTILSAMFAEAGKPGA